MCRRFHAYSVLSTLCLALAPQWVTAEEPPKQRPVHVEVTLVVVPVVALKRAGIDVEELTRLPPPKEGSPQRPHLPVVGRASKAYVDSDTLPAVVLSLMQEDVGRVLARSRIETISGHRASLQLGDSIELEATPEALDNNNIKLEYFWKFSEPLPQSEIEKRNNLPPGKRQISSSMGIKLTAGKITAETAGPVIRTNPAGETDEVAFVTLLHADFKPRSIVRAAPMPQPLLPVREEGYQDIEVPKRR